MVVRLEGSPISTEELWSFVTSLTKALIPRLLSLAAWPALGRVWWFFHLRMMEDTIFLGTFNAAEMFWYPSPNPVSEFYRQFLEPHGLVFALTLSTVGPYIDRYVLFQIMSNQFNLPQVDSNQVVETSQG